MAHSDSAGQRVPLGVLAAYAAPAFSQALIHGPVNTVIQGIYGKHFGLELASIATVLLLARVFDGVTDPLIGYWSDKYRSRWGRRKPWLLVGSMVAVFACWRLYIPAGEVTFGSFLFWFLLAYFGWTLSEIPYRAWLAEISTDYHERTRLATWRTFARYMGFLAFYGVPFLPMFATTEFTPETLEVTAWLAAIALPLTAVIACYVVPTHAASLTGEASSAVEEDSPGDPVPGAPTPATLSAGETLRSVWANRPLRLFLVIYAISGIATGSAFGSLFFFVDSHLQLGAALALLFVLGSPIGAAAMPFWSALAARIGKQRTWAIASVMSASAMAMHLLIPAGPDGELMLYVCFGLVFVASSVGVVMPAALLADVVDYGRLKFGQDYAGTYFAVQTMIEKAVEGLGVALGLAIASSFGFDPTASEQSASGSLGLMLAFPIVPAIFTCLTVPFIWRFPIDARRHRIIMRRLAQRAERQLVKEQPNYVQA